MGRSGDRQSPANVLQKDHQLQWVRRRRLEVVLRVESPRPIDFGMREDDPDADDFRRLRASWQCLEQHAVIDPAPLFACGAGEARQKDGRDVLPGPSPLAQWHRWE